MIDPQAYAMAQAYEQLATHPAFVDLREWIVMEEDRLAKDAAEASVSEPSSVWRAKFQAWQQAKRLRTLIDDRMAMAAISRAEAAQEAEIERANERDRAGRDGWNR